MKNQKLITKNILLTGDSIAKKRIELEEYFLKTYELFESLFDIFVDDSVFYERPEPLRHQLIFYFGHTSTFFINKLIVAKQIKERVNPSFESIFAIGVDEMSWDDLDEENYDWPTANQVRAYREIVKKIVIDYIRNMEFTLAIDWNNIMWPIIMGIEHEKIHIETSSVLHRQLDIKFIKENSIWNDFECKTYGNYPKNELLNVDNRGVTVLGKKMDSNLYGWDLEYGHYEEVVDGFKASKFLVSNGEFLEFIEDNAYNNNEFWSYEGKNWKDYKNAEFPLFWSKKEGEYYYRTLTEIIKLPLNWPVDVNFLEAEAFCNWKSKKTGKKIDLPTEIQWHTLREYCGVDTMNWGDIANINLEHFSSSCEVDRFNFDKGFYDIVGNVWQWTKTPLAPLEGFKVHPIYDDFSVPTFDGRHNLFMGGSWASTGNEATKYARYAFRRHFYQHAGFRYVENPHTVGTNSCIRPLEPSVRPKNTNGNPLRLRVPQASGILEVLKDIVVENDNILNLGSNHGELIFKIRKKLNNKITGIDFTSRNVLVAQKELEKSNLDKIEFWQGDSCNLKPHFKDYNIIIATNNYQELYDFDKFLNILNDRLLVGGYLIMALKDLPIGFEQNVGVGLVPTQDSNGKELMIWKKQ